MIRPMSWSSGLRSAPSLGTLGSRRSKGLEVTSTKARKPVLTSPSTPSTRATMSRGSSREKREAK